jgi:3-methyladenine DNA glycosylase AlkC
MKNSKMDKKLLLKDQLFNREKVNLLSNQLYGAYPQFKKSEFVCDVIAKFPELELKARISWITKCLKKYLPNEYHEAIAVILKALPKPNNPELLDNDFGDFIYAPYADFVAHYGCTKENLSFSLRALREMTTRFSAEDAIRYFINAFPKETMKELLAWSKDAHYHVRRLCSEGTRPKLPWSQKIFIPITASLPILDNLFSDRTRFVTRSVANHINDISKIEPDLAMSTLAKWEKSGKQKSEEMEYIIRHSLRTLVKYGNPKALNLLGIHHQPKIDISQFKVSKKVALNTNLEFSLLIKADEDTTIVADYILHFQNKSGKLNSKKVSKLKKFALGKDKSVTLFKKHPLRQFMTTRTIYPGKHCIEIQINGNILAKKSFEVIEK